MNWPVYKTPRSIIAKKQRASKRRSKKQLTERVKKEKTWRKRKNEQFDFVIREYIPKFRRDLPKSERWFWSLIEKFGLELDADANIAIGLKEKIFIIDVFSIKYMLAIEIDGESHNTETQKTKDRVRDSILKNKRITTFRIKAYDEADFIAQMLNVYKYLNTKEYKFNNFINILKIAQELIVEQSRASEWD